MSGRGWMHLALAGTMVLAGVTAHATEAVLTADTYLNSTTPSSNYGSLTNLYVNSSGVTLLSFDLSSLPTGTTATQIGKATLRIWVNRVNTKGLVQIAPVTGSWQESTATYNGKPGTGSTIASFTAANANQFVAIDVTAQVQSWVTSPSSNFGLALKSSVADLVLDSKESNQTSHAASLDITVVSQGPRGATGAQGPQGLTGATGAVGPQGLQGLTGATGAQGPKGDTGATGTFSYAGQYGAETVYAKGALVFDAAVGSSYISLTDGNLGHDPASDTINWAMVAQVGATGATGATGAQGPQGVQGIPGIPGIPGPIGPVGAIGATGAAGAGFVAGIPNQIYMTDTTGNPGIPATIQGDISFTSVGPGMGNATINDSAVTTPKLTDGSVTASKLWATGSATSSTYLRGDGTWATPSGGSSSYSFPTSIVTPSTTLTATAGSFFYMVQDTCTSGLGTPPTVTLPTATVAGQTLVLAANCTSGSPDNSTPADGFYFQSKSGELIIDFYDGYAGNVDFALSVVTLTSDGAGHWYVLNNGGVL